MEGFNLFNEIPVRKQSLNRNETKINLVFKRSLKDFVMPHQNEYNLKSSISNNSTNKNINSIKEYSISNSVKEYNLKSSISNNSTNKNTNKNTNSIKEYSISNSVKGYNLKSSISNNSTNKNTNKNTNSIKEYSINKNINNNTDISLDNIMQNVTKRDKILQKRSQSNRNKRFKVNFIELNKEFKINILEEQKPRALVKKKIENKKRVKKHTNFKSYPKYVDVKYKNSKKRSDNLIEKLLSAFGFKN